MPDRAELALRLERLKALIERLESEQAAGAMFRETAAHLRLEAEALVLQVKPRQPSEST